MIPENIIIYMITPLISAVNKTSQAHDVYGTIRAGLDHKLLNRMENKACCCIIFNTKSEYRKGKSM